MIEVSNVVKEFDGFRALDGTTLHVGKGDIYGLVGPNGAGKSTIIRHITGVYKQDAGTVLIDGMPVFENPAVKEKFAYIPDELFYFMQADTMEMKRFYQGIYPKFDEKLFEKMRKFFPNIDTKRSIRRLSKGMQKQVAFWLAICCRPEILILDEPVDGLDPVMRRQIWSIIMADVSEHETTVFVSSHNLRELEDICDHVGLLYKGGILLSKELEEMKYHIHKVQCVFQNAGDEEEILAKLEVLQHEKRGSVMSIVARGTKQEILMTIQEKNPLLAEILPLTLEEIFISETEVAGYEVKNLFQ